MINAEEKQGYLDLVEEIQQERENRIDGDAPYVLLPYQQRWQQDQTDVRVCEKSRRIGWSWGMASEAVLEAAEQGGMSQYYVGYNLPMAAEFIGDCAFFAKAFSFAAGEIQVGMETEVIENERRDIVKYSIRFANGKKIEALSSAPHNFRGRQGHARIDEAAFHPELGELLKAAMAWLMWGGRVSVVSTHNGIENDFNLLVREVRAGKKNYSIHKVTLDDALRDGLYQRIALVRGIEWTPTSETEFRDNIYEKYGDAASEELDCIPSSGSGVYLPRILIERCAKSDIGVLRYSKDDDFVMHPDRLEITKKWVIDNIKPIIDNLPPDKRTVLGEDFGRSGDLSVNWVLQNINPSKWRTALLLEMRNIPFDCQQLIGDYLLDELPLFHHGKFDARGNGQSHAEHAAQKKPGKIECVMATAQWYAMAFPKYKQAYEDQSIEVPQNEDVIADHRRVILVKGRPTMDDGKDKGSDGKQRHGDSAIAGVMAWMAALEDGVVPAGVTIEQEDYKDGYVPTRLQNRVRLFG